jgi:hypothetical protein
LTFSTVSFLNVENTFGTATIVDHQLKKKFLIFYN